MMLKIYRISLAACSLLMAVIIFAAAPASASAQTDTGSFEELLDLDLAPLETSETPLPGLPYLAEPEDLQVAPSSVASFSIGPPEVSSMEPQSVLEVPHIALDPVDTLDRVDAYDDYDSIDSGELVLPDLSVPTPENSRADIAPALRPRLQAPQPLSYSRNLAVPSSSYDRYRRPSVPLQIQFYTVRQVNPAFTYGVRPNPYSYRPSGYLPYGGYQPYGGYGGYRGSPGPRPSRGPGCSGRR